MLIGANASGKSNAIEGLRLLSWLAQGNKLSSLQHATSAGESVVRGRTNELARDGGDEFTLGVVTNRAEWDHLELTVARRRDGLHIVGESLTSPHATVPLYRIELPAAERGSDAEVAYNDFAKGGHRPRVTCSDQSAIFTQLTSPATFAARHRRAQTTIPRVCREYEAWLSRTLFLDPAPSRMRDYASVPDPSLLPDGRNLSAVLHHLWGSDVDKGTARVAEQRSELLGFIRSLPEQDITGISFLTEPRGGVMVSLTETFGGQSRQYDASLLSDGTLRVLSVAAALLSAPEDGLVVIEEIDNGVHPGRAGHLLERIRAVAQRRRLRVLLSTHNPALLDALPDAALGDVVFCYRAPADGSSQLVRLRDLPTYPELVAQGPLGQLVTSGQLDRFVKHQPSAEERKIRALAWLSGLRAEAAR